MLRGVKLIITWYDSKGIKRSAERIYRNHWPLEIPQDQQQPSTGTANNRNSGTNNTNNNNENPED
jgi:hypothetical protein